MAGLFIGEGICSGCNPFNLRDGFSRLGNGIGTNSKVKHLRVSISEGLELDVTHREFFDGLTRNSSIRKLRLDCYSRNITDPIIHEILRAYQTNSDNLVEFHIRALSLQNGDRILAATIESCTNLTILDIRGNDINDEQLLGLTDAMRGNRSLEVLNLEENEIGDAGCEALSTLLTNPQSKLLSMNLQRLCHYGLYLLLVSKPEIRSER